MMRRDFDLTGRRFGRLTVLVLSGSTDHGARVWLVRCDCGNEKQVRGNSLKTGDVKSCGCLNRDRRTYQQGAGNPNFKHGHGSVRRGCSLTYHSWQAMKNRCTCPSFWTVEGLRRPRHHGLRTLARLVRELPLRHG
jgi:hypothetical protein